MKNYRIDFLKDILSLELGEEHQLMIVNEWLSTKGKTPIVRNDEYGLETICGGMSIAEILRASCYGNYVVTEPYVFINDHGNLESTSDICYEWQEVAKWMLDGGYEKSFDAWNILNNISYVETGNFQNDFVDEFPYRVDVEPESVNEWFEYADYTLSYLFLTSWEELKSIYEEWRDKK